MKRLFMEIVIAGFIIAYLTGFLGTTPDCLQGPFWGGFPLTWKKDFITPSHATEYDFVNFFFDFLFWSVLIGVLMLLYEKLRKR